MADSVPGPIPTNTLLEAESSQDRVTVVVPEYFAVACKVMGAARIKYDPPAWDAPTADAGRLRTPSESDREQSTTAAPGDVTSIFAVIR